jgi:hypothetical protein
MDRCFCAAVGNTTDSMCAGQRDYIIQQFCVKESLVFSLFCCCVKCDIGPVCCLSNTGRKECAQIFQEITENPVFQ